MTSHSSRPQHGGTRGKAPRTTHKPAIGLALAGGGPLGAVYEIGALAAIEEAIEGLDLNDVGIYVGISAGGIIAAGLANGISPHEMCRLFIESDLDDEADSLFKPELLLKPAWGELARRLAAVPQAALTSSLHYASRAGRTGVARSFERMKDVLPAGLFSGNGIHEYISRVFSVEGRTNDFRELDKQLVLVATDLDSGESVRFGGPGWDHVPISRAAQASAAVPGLFPPVEIDGRHFVDGVLKKTLHASIALDQGVDLLICLNPIVPYNAKIMYAPGKLAQGGLLTVLSQSLRTIIHSRVEIGMTNYAKTYPDADILLFEPSQEDAEMFFTNLFSTSSRRRMCESAYQQTREMLWRNREEIGRRLERHGLRLKVQVLRDTSLTLVRQPAQPKKDRFATARLEDTLDSLERYLKVANG